MLEVLLVGFGLSFLGSAPMTGPLALLVLDRAVMAQRRSALWIAFSGALVEGTLAAGIGAFLPLVLRHSQLIVDLARVSGAFVILGVGLTLVLRPGVLSTIKTERKRQSFAAGFLTTALNPTLLATWTVVVTALHANGLLEGGYAQGVAFGAGVAAGSLVWFVLVVLLSRRFAGRGAASYRGAIARAIGVILIVLSGLIFVRVALEGRP